MLTSDAAPVNALAEDGPGDVGPASYVELRTQLPPSGFVMALPWLLQPFGK